MQLSRTAYPFAILNLSVTPILSRASTTTGALHSLTQTPSSRLYTVLFPQCPSIHRGTEQNRRAHTMSTPQSEPTASKPESETQKSQSQEEASTQQAQEHLYLPSSESSGGGQQAPRLDLGAEGGSTVTLDHLGPMVVNTDGTLARIANWEQMTEIERKTTLRVLGKRNKQRLEALKAAEGEGKSE